MSDPASLAIAQDILRESRIPFMLSGAGAESVVYGAGNVALSASRLVEDRSVSRSEGNTSARPPRETDRR